MSDLISFYQSDDNDPEHIPSEEVESWKILIVDDDESIHQVTRLALSWVVLDDKPLEFISAYSGAEAKQIFQEHDDIALVLLDVVMETNKAGFEVANYIRHELNNFLTRIVLRTGQPGDVPEREVILNYEIDGYKTKSELTAQALFSMILTSLRSYRDLRSVEDNNSNLEKVVQATSDIFEQSTIADFIDSLLGHLCDIVPFSQRKDTQSVNQTSLKKEHEPYYFAADFNNGRLSYVKGAAGIDYQLNEELFQHLSPTISSLLIEAHNKHITIYRDGHLVIAGSGRFQQALILYFAGVRPLDQSFEHLLDVFRHNYETAYENLLLNIENQKHSENLAKCLEQRVEELNQLRDKLFYSEKLSAIGHLAVGVAQEINKPLGLMKNHIGQFHTRLKPLWELLDILEKLSHSSEEEQFKQIQWLSNEVDFGQLRKKLPEVVFAADGDIQRIYNIVEVLHQFSRLETSSFRKTDIQRLLTHVIENIPYQRGIRIHSEYEQTPLITIMPDQIAEVFNYLIQNAIEALPGEGAVAIKVSCDEDSLNISVSDTGEGIDGQFFKQVFEPFYSSKSTHHTGLGLYLSKTIINLHNGKISLQSELNQGSTFVINLPINH